VITTIRNNDDATITITAWFCEENDSIDIHAFKDKPKSPIIHHITHQGALMMRAYYVATVNVDTTGGTVKVYINDCHMLTCSSGNYHLAGWTEWTYGSTGIVNITLVEEGVPDDDFGIHYSIDRYQIMFGKMGLTMSASESVNLSMNWTVIQKNPRLIITTSNATNSMNVSVSGTDLAVTDVSVSDDLVWDGDSVNIDATITNFGGMNASNFTVAFYDIMLDVYDSDPIFITVENVPRLDAGDSMNVTVPWTASLKVGGDISYKHLIGVMVVPQDWYIEDNSTNNIGYSNTTTVKRSRDFSVTDIKFFRYNETIDPMDLRMGELAKMNASVEITNLASCGGSVDLICYLDNTTLINSTVVPFPANNGTVYAEFEWEVCDHGNHTITVIADPKNETSEFDESNNASSRSISIRAPDLVVTNLTFDPESPEEGGMVNITADVGNLGNNNASDVTVRFIDESFTDGMIHTVPYILDTPHPLPDYNDYTWVIQHQGAHKMRVHFTRLILPNSYFYINAKPITYGDECNITNLTTDWVDGDRIIMDLNIGGCSDGKWGFNMDRYEYMGRVEDVQIPSLDAGYMKNVTVRWNATPAGEHDITAIIDPEDIILESDESNNELTRTLIIQGADLTVSDMRITANGTEINGTETVVVAGDVVNISAIVTNIGIRPASNFSVSFCADGIEIANTTNLSLDMGEFVNVSAKWDATIGNYTINVTADPEKQIHETNESNNTAAMDVSVQGADLSITDITYMVIPPDNATSDDTCSRVYDTDTILINTTIANQGILPADNFSVHIFYEEKGLGGYEFQYYRRGWMWRNKTLEGAGCVFVGIMNAKNVKDNIKIYDRNGTLAISPEGDGWFFVDGDEANVHYNSNARIEVSMGAYAGEYRQYDHLSIRTGQSMNLTMPQQVFTGDHPIRVFVDLEDCVCENSEENNYADTALTIYPSRDFTVNDMQLFHNGSLIGVNDTIMDGDGVLVDVTVGMGINDSDTYRECRKGDADVAIIDEHEWVNLSPRFELTPYGYAQVITHPGTDAIRVHFDEMSLAPYAGCVEIRDGNRTVQWSRGYYDGATDQSSWVDGDVIYVYNVEKTNYYNYVWGRTTFSIDKYQYRRSNHTIVPLAAGETRDITTGWDMSAGSHTIQATADRGDAVGEINESNNEICKTLNVDACKDPVILNITFDPEKPTVGSDVVINAAIMNNGNRNVSFAVDLWAEKTEYHPLESPHDGEFPPGNCEWGIPSTYSDADWMGIHFARIEMSTGTGEQKLNRDLYVRDENNTMADNLCGLNETDVWTWVKGDTTKLSTTPCTLFPDYPVPVWGFEITDHRYKIVLNRTTLTLTPNKTVDVTGILRNVRAGNHSMNYTVHASLDMGNVIYEVNESNNEMVRILNLAVPDFTVKIQPVQDGNIRAVFRNRGFGSADARVFFSRDIGVDDSVSGSHYRYVPNKTIRKSIDWTDDIDWTRIHFEEMKIRGGGYVEVGNERYTESKSDFWTPWVKGDRIKIKYRTAHFKIDRYDFAEEDIIDDFGAGSEKLLNIPGGGYTEPYNLTVWIDPLNEALEGNEDDNNDTVFVYADLMADRIEFVSPEVSKLCLDAEKFVIDGHIKNGNGGRDDIVAPVSNFDITLEVRHWYPNDTVGDLVFNMTKHVGDPIYADKDEAIRFEFDPNEKFDAGGNYTVSLMVDSSGDICESNEENNVTKYVDVHGDEYVHVYNSSGYTGGGELINIAQGEVNGRVVYTIGDSKRLSGGSSGDDRSVSTLTVNYNATPAKVEFARLYLYVDTGSDPTRKIALPIEADMEFNGHKLQTGRRYTDISVGSGTWNVTYGLYCYDVTSYVNTEQKNVAVATRISPKENGNYYFSIAGIGLLIVEEDDDAILTKYWVNEGIDVVMAKNRDHPTGLPFGDCIVSAEFDGVEREDLDGVNATFMTILSLFSDKKEYLYEEANGEGDSLKFNGYKIGTLKGGSHWIYQKPNGEETIAMTDNKWEYVTDDLKRGNNIATIQSKGNYIVPSNAFLTIRYPPDLAIINLTAPASTVVGAHHSINATIRNDGRSDAHDFNVTFHIDGKQMVRIPHLDLPAGENMTINLYNWTPMMFMHVYNLTAAVDVLSGEDWTEIETDNNTMTKRVLIEEGGFGNQTGPRGTGGGSNPTGGEFTEEITGRVMQGIKEFLGGGGGGAGMFSLTEWIMKGAVWLVLLLFVGLGYRMEQRSYGRVSDEVSGRL
jgi:subtilase family serine protease